MKITIKLTKKEKELYKKSRNVVSLDSDAGVKLRKELYRVLKELEK